MLSAYFVGQLAFLLLGGVIVDRYSRRLLVVLSDVLQGAIVAGIAALALLGGTSVVPLSIAAFAFGSAQAFAMPALRAFLPETVSASSLAPANALFNAARTTAAVAGPALGGLLIALAGTASAFAFDAATFAVSAMLLAGARSVRPSPAATETGSVLALARAGIRYVARVPWLWIGILVFAAFNLVEAGARNVVLRAFVTGPLGGGPQALGLVASAHMLGTAAGFLIAGNLPIPPARRGLVAYAWTAAAGGAFALVALATSLPTLLALMLVYGVTFAGFNILWENSIMEHVDPRHQGRVFSLDMMGSFALLPVSTILAALAAETLGAPATFVLAGGAMAALALLGMASRKAREFKRHDGA